MTPLPRKKNIVTIPPISKPRTRRNGLTNGSWKRNAELRIATWNTTSLFRIGASQNLVDTLGKYDITVAALQEIRWTGVGQQTIGDYVIYYSGLQNLHQFGSGFAVRKTLAQQIREFKPISERCSVLRLDTKPINICIINIHAPTEVSGADTKDLFFEELTRVYDDLPKNTIKMLIGDMNAKCGREIQYVPMIGKESLHEHSNDNGKRLISFATSNGMIISSTTFPHKDIHKATWKSPDGKTRNQIDHVIIQNRFRSSIFDVRSYRGADCDTDHFLVIAKFKLKLKSPKKVNISTKKRTKINIESLKNEEVRKRYEETVSKEIANVSSKDIDTDWETIRNIVSKAAEDCVGALKKAKNSWYNDNCRRAIERRHSAREKYLKRGTSVSQELFIAERKNCKKVLQQEKRKFINSVLKTAENDHSQGRVRNFFRTIKNFKQFNPVCKVIKDQDGQILMDSKSRVERWKDYFVNLLNGTAPNNPIHTQVFQGAEPLVQKISHEEFETAIAGLKNWKAPGSDGIAAELIKYGGKILHHSLFKLCNKIWDEEQLPIMWKEAIIVPLHKKGDQLECDNYRGISLLNSAYKIFARILLKRLTPYVEECVGDYQCGFRRGKSTIEQLSIIGQIIEKKYEYRQNMWQLFIDFKKAYDSIHRNSLYKIMLEFGFPQKLVQLTKLCMENTQYRVRVDSTVSSPFSVESGLKQGDALSPILFNVALEKVIRELLHTEEGGVSINNRAVRLLGFADDLDIIGETLEDIGNAARVLEKEANKIGLQINANKTKVMELINSGTDPADSVGLAYEKVDDFKYLGTTLSTKNDWSKEIDIRLNKAEKTFYALSKFFNTKMLSRRTKIRIYVAIIRPTLTYGCEAWTTTTTTERKLRTFENRVWRKICGPVLDAHTGEWRRRYNRELTDMLEMGTITNFIKGQRIQWLGHIMRRGENEPLRAALEWVPHGKRPRGRPRKRWLDGVEEDLLRMGIENWREIAYDRDRWREIVVAAKTLEE